MFITFASGDITTLIGYMSGLLGDLLPVILIFMGIAIAMTIYHGFTKH